VDLTVRPVPPDRWPEAGRMAARAFWTEPYMAVLADDPIGLYATVQDVYLGMDVSAPTVTTLGAFVGEHIVGVACIDRAGACFFCELDPDAAAPTDRAHAVLHGVYLAIRELHVGLPPHANIGPIAVEPALQRHGIGRRLLAAAWDAAVADAPATVALDCDPAVLSFYESFGFRQVGRVTDPYGFDIVGLRRDPGEG
jgi:GNAT superfamily N-acetyltransferase